MGKPELDRYRCVTLALDTGQPLDPDDAAWLLAGLRAFEFDGVPFDRALGLPLYWRSYLRIDALSEAVGKVDRNGKSQRTWAADVNSELAANSRPTVSRTTLVNHVRSFDQAPMLESDNDDTPQTDEE
jgi:hypothetical protein